MSNSQEARSGEFAALRQVVLDNYEKEVGPCGAIAVALSRLGFGKIVRLMAISRVGREDCIPSMDHDWSTPNCIFFPHYAIQTPQGSVLDAALPPDFDLVGYESMEVLDGIHEDDLYLWSEDNFSYWQSKFSDGLKRHA